MVLYYFIAALVLSGTILLVRKNDIVRILVLLFLLVQVVFVGYMAAHKGLTELRYFTFDSLGLLFSGLLTLVTILAVFHGFIYFRERDQSRFAWYHSALVGLITSITGAYLANDVTVVWILVEATTLTASVLIYHEKSRAALEATWKYIFLCSTGIAFAYMGILFLSLTAREPGIQGLSFEAIGAAAQNANPLFLKIAFLFVFIGYSTKMELFPMHTVGIDANSVAPSPIGGLMSTGLVNMGFLSIFRIYETLSGTVVREWMDHVLLISGVLSVLVAAGYMLKAKYHKRMFAYSTLETMGLVAIAIGAGGVGRYAAILILVVHTLVKSTLFFQLGQVVRIMRSYKLDESGKYMLMNPVGGMVLLAGIVFILAIPPSGLFAGEYLLFTRLVEQRMWGVLLVVMLLLCFVVYALVTRAFHLLFSDPYVSREKWEPGTVHWWENIGQIVFLVAVMVLCFYQPPFLVALMQ